MSMAEPLAAFQDGEERSAPAAISAVEMRHFVNDIDVMLTSVDSSRIQNLSFTVNDIPFQARRNSVNPDGEYSICLQAVLGYLPFSFESKGNRQAILAIIDASQSLFRVRFGIDAGGRIFAAGKFSDTIFVSPDFIFYPLILFLQEAQPFIDLIGKYL
jgi:hypothetical protein